MLKKNKYKMKNLSNWNKFNEKYDEGWCIPMSGDLLIRFNKPGESYDIIIPAVTNIFDDCRVRTQSKNNISEDKKSLYYTEQWEDSSKQYRILTPKFDFEIFEITNNPKECNLLGIKYYAGTSFYDIVSWVKVKQFIIDEKVPLNRNPKPISQPNAPSEIPRFNEILEYTALKHIPKLPQDIRYEGDCNTLIELSDKCRYQMYKFIRNQKAGSEYSK